MIVIFIFIAGFSIDSVPQKLAVKHTDGDHVIAGCYNNHKHLPDAKHPNLEHATVGMQ